MFMFKKIGLFTLLMAVSINVGSSVMITPMAHFESLVADDNFLLGLTVTSISAFILIVADYMIIDYRKDLRQKAWEKNKKILKQM